MVKIIFEISNGLYLSQHGYYPQYVYNPETFEGDLEEMVYDIPWDFDTAPKQGRNYKRYWIMDVEIPEYFTSPEEWISNWSHWRYFNTWIHFDMYKHHDLTAEMKRKIWNLRDNHAMLFAIHELLKVKTMRSEFRKSIRDQLLEWLRGENDFSTPFSHRQLECLISHNSHDIHCRDQTRIPSLLPI